jgi:hypothetical protein
MFFAAGCAGNGNAHREVQLDDAIASARATHQPLVILIGEFDGGDSLLDDPTIGAKAGGIGLITMDLGISRNRAVAARYHPASTPLLVCLSPRGLIVTRDEPPVTRELVLRRLQALPARAADLDKQLAAIEELNPGEFKDSMVTQQAMAEFLLSRQNAREAIPYLTDLAKSDSISTASRISAWVSLARAHLWVTEPEKARHEAKDLIATLGPKHPEAVAGGNLVRGLQDATARRFSLARQEFEAAVSAAPDSDYAKQARVELEKLQKQGH